MFEVISCSTDAATPAVRQTIDGVCVFLGWYRGDDCINVLAKIVHRIKPLAFEVFFHSAEEPKIGRREVWRVRWVGAGGSS